MAVLINGRTAVHAGSEGTLTTQDTCYTGPFNQPITYQNIAKSADAENTAKTVFINGHPVCHKNSYFAKSYGSEAGNSGINSGTIGGKAEFTTASSNVFIEGIPAVRQGDLMVSNNRNTPPAPLMQKGVPYGGDKDKINKFPKIPYPKLELDLSELTLLKFGNFANIFVYREITLSLTGTISLEKIGETNPLTFNLDEYKISGRQTLSNFCDFFTVIHYSSQQIGIGSSETGEFWSTSVEFQTPNKWIYTASPQPFNRNYQGWLINGELGFTLTLETEKNPFLPMLIPLPEPIYEIGQEIGKKILLFLLDAIIAVWAEG